MGVPLCGMFFDKDDAAIWIADLKFGNSVMGFITPVSSSIRE